MPNRRRYHLLAPYAVLVTSALLTSAVVYYAWRANAGVSRARFENRTLAIVKEVQDRVSSNLAALRAARALLQDQESIPRGSFEKFVELLRPTENYPGIRGLAVNRRIGK